MKVLGIVSLHVAPDPLLPRPCAAWPWLWLSSEQNSEIKEALRCTGHNYLTQDTPLPYYQHSFPESPQDSQELQLNELYSASLEAEAPGKALRGASHLNQVAFCKCPRRLHT